MCMSALSRGPGGSWTAGLWSVNSSSSSPATRATGRCRSGWRRISGFAVAVAGPSGAGWVGFRRRQPGRGWGPAGYDGPRGADEQAAGEDCPGEPEMRVSYEVIYEDYLKLLKHKPVTCGDAREKGCSE
jgi:hypothetical protein